MKVIRYIVNLLGLPNRRKIIDNLLMSHGFVIDTDWLIFIRIIYIQLKI